MRKLEKIKILRGSIKHINSGKMQGICWALWVSMGKPIDVGFENTPELFGIKTPKGCMYESRWFPLTKEGDVQRVKLIRSHIKRLQK